MNTNPRVRSTARSSLAMLCIACGLVACTTQQATSTGTGGGAAGGSGGATGGDGTLCPAPQQAITNFTSCTGTTECPFGPAGGLQGSEYFYPTSGNYPLTVDFSQGNMHLTGTVGDYSGIHLYFYNCDHLNASQFKGISFTVSGSVPQGDQISFSVGTLNDTPTGAWMRDPGGSTTAKATDAGRCTPTSGNQYYHPGCTDPTIQIPVTATPTVQKVQWANLIGGQPDASPNPSEITGQNIYWVIPWSGSAATPYQLDLVLDDIAFIP